MPQNRSRAAKKKKRPVKLPIRLNAKPTRPHATKKGPRSYRRARAKATLRRELRRENQ